VKVKQHWKLVFLGDGPTMEKVKERAVKLELDNLVEFHGNVHNVDEFYAKSKIFAFT